MWLQNETKSLDVIFYQELDIKKKLKPYLSM